MPLKRTEMDNTCSGREQAAKGRAGGESGEELISRPASNLEILQLHKELSESEKTQRNIHPGIR